MSTSTVQTKETKNSFHSTTGLKHNSISQNVIPVPNAQQSGPMTVQKIPGLSVFLTKTYNIFSINEYAEKDWCSWGANGDTIVFKSVSSFCV